MSDLDKVRNARTVAVFLICLMKLFVQTLLTELTHLHSLDCANFQHDQVSKLSSERSGTPKKRKAPPPPVSPTQVKTKANQQ